MNKQGDIFIAGSQTASEVTGKLVSSNISLVSGTATRSTELTVYCEVGLTNSLPIIKAGIKWTRKSEDHL